MAVLGDPPGGPRPMLFLCQGCCAKLEEGVLATHKVMVKEDSEIYVYLAAAVAMQSPKYNGLALPWLADRVPVDATLSLGAVMQQVEALGGNEPKETFQQLHDKLASLAHSVTSAAGGLGAVPDQLCVTTNKANSSCNGRYKLRNERINGCYSWVNEEKNMVLYATATTQKFGLTRNLPEYTGSNRQHYCTCETVPGAPGQMPHELKWGRFVGYRGSDNSRLSTKRAGLVLSIADGYADGPSVAAAHIFVTGVLEYLAAELIEVAGNEAKHAEGEVEITRDMLFQAMRDDPELDASFPISWLADKDVSLRYVRGVEKVLGQIYPGQSAEPRVLGDISTLLNAVAMEVGKVAGSFGSVATAKTAVRGLLSGEVKKMAVSAGVEAVQLYKASVGKLPPITPPASVGWHPTAGMTVVAESFVTAAAAAAAADAAVPTVAQVEGEPITSMSLEDLKAKVLTLPGPQHKKKRQKLLKRIKVLEAEEADPAAAQKHKGEEQAQADQARDRDQGQIPPAAQKHAGKAQESQARAQAQAQAHDQEEDHAGKGMWHASTLTPKRQKLSQRARRRLLQEASACESVAYRVDSADGMAYPLDSFVDVYGGSVDRPPPQWGAAAPAGNGWHCAKCTFINSPMALSCGSCGALEPRQLSFSSSVAAPPTSSCWGADPPQREMSPPPHRRREGAVAGRAAGERSPAQITTAAAETFPAQLAVAADAVPFSGSTSVDLTCSIRDWREDSGNGPATPTLATATTSTGSVAAVAATTVAEEDAGSTDDGNSSGAGAAGIVEDDWFTVVGPKKGGAKTTAKPKPKAKRESERQATRPARRLFVGNLPVGCSSEELAEYFNSEMDINGWAVQAGRDAVFQADVNDVGKPFGFLEFQTTAECTAAYENSGYFMLYCHDGRDVKYLRLERPKNYVAVASDVLAAAEAAAPAPAPTTTAPAEARSSFVRVPTVQSIAAANAVAADAEAAAAEAKAAAAKAAAALAKAEAAAAEAKAAAAAAAAVAAQNAVLAEECRCVAAELADLKRQLSASISKGDGAAIETGELRKTESAAVAESAEQRTALEAAARATATAALEEENRRHQSVLAAIDGQLTQSLEDVGSDLAVVLPTETAAAARQQLFVCEATLAEATAESSRLEQQFRSRLASFEAAFAGRGEANLLLASLKKDLENVPRRVPATAAAAAAAAAVPMAGQKDVGATTDGEDGDGEEEEEEAAAGEEEWITVPLAPLRARSRDSGASSMSGEEDDSDHSPQSDEGSGDSSSGTASSGTVRRRMHNNALSGPVKFSPSVLQRPLTKAEKAEKRARKSKDKNKAREAEGGAGALIKASKKSITVYLKQHQWEKVRTNNHSIYRRTVDEHKVPIKQQSLVMAITPSDVAACRNVLSRLRRLTESATPIAAA